MAARRSLPDSRSGVVVAVAEKEVLEFDGDSGNNRVVPAVSYAERKHLAVACTGGDYAAGVAEIAADEH